jgi:phosphatidate cytidylyltransferase
MRALTGAVFVIVLIGGILWRYESFAALFLLITILGLWEFYGLVEKAGAKPQKVFGTFTGAFLFIALASCFWADYGVNLLWVFTIPLLFLMFIFELYRKKEQPFTNIAYTIFGIVYIALPFSLLVFLPAIGSHEGNIYQPMLILGFFLLMWTSDTGAYLSGKAFGKHKLFERISPKKTWEGTVGGAGLCIILACVFGYFRSVWGLDTLHWIVVALIIVIAGNLGDLSESMFKRSINIKDSGTILPGHGGILDRFDAVLIAAPFVFVYLKLLPFYS